MVFVAKIFTFLISIIVGILVLKYTEAIVRTFGKNVYAEQYLGAGGTYNMWKIIGILIPVLTLVYILKWA